MVRNDELTGGPGAGDGINGALLLCAVAKEKGVPTLVLGPRRPAPALPSASPSPIFFLLGCWAYGTASIMFAAAAVAREKGSGGDVPVLGADALHVFDEMTMPMYGGNLTMF